MLLTVVLCLSGSLCEVHSVFLKVCDKRRVLSVLTLVVERDLTVFDSGVGVANLHLGPRAGARVQAAVTEMHKKES